MAPFSPPTGVDVRSNPPSLGSACDASLALHCCMKNNPDFALGATLGRVAADLALSSRHCPAPLFLTLGTPSSSPKDCQRRGRRPVPSHVQIRAALCPSRPKEGKERKDLLGLGGGPVSKLASRTTTPSPSPLPLSLSLSPRFLNCPNRFLPTSSLESAAVAPVYDSQSSSLTTRGPGATMSRR